MPVNISIPELGNKFQDYRQGIPGDSFNWGPVIKPQDIKFFTFHHSVTKQTAKIDGNWKKECDVIANSHIAQGWAGVGYRFIICSDGTVAYVGDLSHGGSAVANNNNIMFSACLVGDFTKELPTAAQIHSAHLLAKLFLTQMPSYPNLNNWDQIKGHKNFNPTQCPGTNWEGVPDSLRNRVVGDKWQGYPNPQPSAPTPPTPPPAPPVDPTIPLKKRIAELEVQVKDLQIQITTLQNKASNAIAELS
jgi:hypothetical protein